MKAELLLPDQCFLKKNYLNFYVANYFAFVYVYATSVFLVPMEARRGCWIPRTGVPESCELHMGAGT